MQTVILSIPDNLHRKLIARAARALLPLDRYIVAAAADPLKFAWPEDPSPVGQKGN